MIVPYNNQDYYKKQVDVARLFRVSEGTITNWIKRGKENKNLLQLSQINNRFYILKTEHNFAELTKLSIEAEDFQNVEYRQIEPSNKLYEYYTENQIIGLINSIKIKKSIPVKYVYMGKGAHIWDEFYNKTQNSESYGTPSRLFLLEKAMNFLEDYIAEFDSVTVTDIGCGNYKPTKLIVDKVFNENKLKKYVAMDISSEMLKIAKKEFVKDFPEDKFESCEIDVELNSTQDYLLKYKDLNSKSLNILIMFGGAVGNSENQVKVFSHIKDGMYPEDVLIVDNVFDDVAKRTKFPAFEHEEGAKHVLFARDILNLAKIQHDLEFIYNNETKYREVNLIFKENISINFKKEDTVVNFEIGQKLNIWKQRKDTFEFITEKISASELKLLYISKHPTETDIIYISRVV